MPFGAHLYLYVCVSVCPPQESLSAAPCWLPDPETWQWPSSFGPLQTWWIPSVTQATVTNCSPYVYVSMLACVCECVRDVNFFFVCLFFKRWCLTRMAALSNGGGWVRRYSVACSMVVVLSKASIACSLEKPMSISCTKGHESRFYYLVSWTRINK